MKPTTYKSAGVDIELADRFLQRAKKNISGTFTPGVLTGIGHFGAFFQPDFTGMKEPVLVSSTDGVGTKLKVAQMAGIHHTIGQDLVNHCVNDILCTGADPMYFMDYLAMSSMDEEAALKVIEGLCRAAEENGVAVIGGETAEMPGIYQPGEYDLAGTIVGMVDRGVIIDGKWISAGDVLIGLPSNGLHTNGYSLARKVCFEIMKFKVDDRIEGLEGAIGEELLRVHRSYLNAVRPLLQKYNIKGLAHITGGGITGNTKRIIPVGRELKINWKAWDIPSIFRLIAEWGGVPQEDMRRTFNLGIGMVIVVNTSEVEAVSAELVNNGESPVIIGEVL